MKKTNELSKILFVDDSEDICQIAELALREIGKFNVTVFTSGKSALENLKAINPQLIILDVMMPEIDGISLFKEIKKIEEIPIIFMTAKVQKQDIENYLSLGVLDVIQKPFDPMELSTLIKNIWNRYYAAN